MLLLKYDYKIIILLTLCILHNIYSETFIIIKFLRFFKSRKKLKNIRLNQLIY